MYIVLADDLTGAMDTGIQFRKYGLQTSVIVSADDCELRGDACAEAISINNSSRELSGTEAYEKTLRAVRRLSLSPQDVLYKKIDSMMRGNPVQEIDAALEASGCRKAIVAPSFPQEGRVVRLGVLHLPDGSYQDLLRRWHARELPTSRDDVHKSTPWDGIGKIFVVTGSMKMETAAQIRQLSQKGFQIVPLHVAALNCAEDKVKEISDACRATAAALHDDGPGVVLTFDYLLHTASEGGSAESETTPEQRKAALHLAGSLGAVVRAQDDRLYDAMILVGGDTALSVCQALNVHRICLWDEVASGMPAGIFGDGTVAGLPVVTKSGAFGDCKALSRAVEYIKKE